LEGQKSSAALSFSFSEKLKNPDRKIRMEEPAYPKTLDKNGNITTETRKLGKVRALHEIYRFNYTKSSDQHAEAPFWGGKEFGQCKVLLKKLGDVDRAAQLINYVFSNWGWIAREVDLSGPPSIGDILGRCLRFVDRRNYNYNEKRELATIRI
jgi:hypothetical protein